MVGGVTILKVPPILFNVQLAASTEGANSTRRLAVEIGYGNGSARPDQSSRAPATGGKFNLLIGVEVPMKSRSAASPGLGITISWGLPGELSTLLSFC